MKKGLLICLFMLMIAITPTLALAASPWTEKTTYAEKTIGKLEFGVKNTLLGWTDLITEPNGAQNAWAGLGKGLVDGIVNTVGGVIHLVTFPIPVDVPLPENGVQF